MENNKKCFNVCEELGVVCPHTDCRHWIEYEADYGCSIITANVNGGGLKLKDIAPRLGLTLARINQIEHEARKKAKKHWKRCVLE